ncbi:hypothetical protein P170DRAFT_447752 [Aspergillus steynii IBT 23096]|uniref:Protein kinase domain-containing protein n=1 Tax=Aspergillus steynii IBT 23096 TaxID=1392250 RepID=A0A2I2G4W1_9EURO|nr:uncharacterized protein P170DRAFT_447752 [Aspergillus steynii IBT 23096]PLB47907.1 hypothetical protein P170DRAFT_447752 [Aspergillus steynii IBT 23096]
MAVSIADSSCSPNRSVGLLLDPDHTEPPRPKQSMWHRLGLRRWLGRDDRDFSSQPPAGSAPSPNSQQPSSRRRNPHNPHNPPSPHATSVASSNPSNANPPPPPPPPPKPHDTLTRRLSRKVGVGLPRATTFKRQNSERRDNLAPLNPEPRRAVSADRRRPLSSHSHQRSRSRSPQPAVDPRLSAPEVAWRGDHADETTVEELPETNEDPDLRSEWNPCPDVTDVPEEPPDEIIEMELEKRWILNLSMHFRDRSEREKFFVTYAEAPNRWRRVTISCDYRGAPPDSLEQDLKELRYQRDKCARIYESIRESLPEIQFYDTVTNLKLETRDGRLHVHVTEDVNEIIPYPPASCIGHLPEARRVPEQRLHFDAHLSGFVYNVRLDGRSFIKKEIPGPDTVDEFLYEINALHALQGTPNVVQVEGVVVDEYEEVVKGLLISFAEKGALVDILYENRGLIAWERRERWARQIVQGLCEIHEAGYVQGDFTLSNIVVDGNDDAKIIDINRRGCPVGWEPPEIAAKIESNQRISMYIGVKTDIFQLGMTLWALAMEEDEPERQPRPLVLDEDRLIPDYYRRLVSICLSPTPRHRLSAKELLNFFPRDSGMSIDPPAPMMQPRHMGVGFGLHNGAFPWYNPRAMTTPSAFLQPRPAPNDSMEPRALSGGGYGYTPQTDEDVHALRPLAPEDYHYRSDLVSDDNDIDLDVQMNSLYRRPSVDQSADLLPFPVDPLSQELAGVGSHPTCSLGPGSTNQLKCDESPPLSSAATHSTDPYSASGPDFSHALIRDQDWAGPSRSVSSLLHSMLPINPAFSKSEQKLLETHADRFSPLTVRSALGYSRQILQEHTSNLSDSHLPINPAFTASV